MGCTEICRMSGIPLNGPCDGEECDSCGWNPRVERRRKLQIYDLARKKRLFQWGKPTAGGKEKAQEGTALSEILFNILTEDIRVWLWDQNGECIYSGTRMGALNAYAHCTVKRWRLDGEIFRADVLAERPEENPPEMEVERDGE